MDMSMNIVRYIYVSVLQWFSLLKFKGDFLLSIDEFKKIDCRFLEKINVENKGERREEFYVNKSSSLLKNSFDRLHYNILANAKNDKAVKEVVQLCANNGWFLVDHYPRFGVSKFAKFVNEDQFIKYFKLKDIRCYGGVFYTLSKPKVNNLHGCRLLVIFSSIADYPLNASIARRSFYANWSKVQRYIPLNTYVLRIADIGGPLGAFYLSTVFDSNFENKIQSLLSFIITKLQINKDDVVLFGTSKGATGALYHSLLGDYNSVCVDPIVSDNPYFMKGDLHFSNKQYKCSKFDKFVDLSRKKLSINSRGIYLVTSSVSHQYEFINKLFYRQNTNIYVVDNELIKGHPDVGDKTIVLYTTLINSIFYGISSKDKINMSFSIKY